MCVSMPLHILPIYLFHINSPLPLLTTALAIVHTDGYPFARQDVVLSAFQPHFSFPSHGIASRSRPTSVCPMPPSYLSSFQRFRDLGVPVAVRCVDGIGPGGVATRRLLLWRVVTTAGVFLPIGRTSYPVRHLEQRQLT